MAVRTPGFVNPLKNLGDLITVDAAGNVVAISAAGLVGLATPWSATVSYGAGAIVSGSDDNVYVSIAGSNVSNDPTTDGGVHWKLIAGLHSAIVAPVGPITDTEALIVQLALIPLATLRVGSKVRIVVEGTCTSTHADIPTFNIRAGTNGTTGDTLVAAVALPVSVVGGPVAFKATFEFTVETLGAAGTCAGSLALLNAGITGLSLTQVQVIPFTSATLHTDTSTFLDLSFVAAAVTTGITVADASIEVTP